MPGADRAASLDRQSTRLQCLDLGLWGILIVCPAEPVEPSLMMRRYWGHGRAEQGCPNLPAVVDRRSLMPITATTSQLSWPALIPHT